MRPLNIDHLRTLVAIADSGSMTSASRLLHLSTAALSLHVAELERRVGGRVLVRHARGVTLNAAGRALVDRARFILSQCQVAEEEARSLARERSSRLRVAALTFFVLEMLPAIARDESSPVETRSIDFVVTDASTALQMLYADDVDLAIMTQQGTVANEDYAVTRLCSLPVCAFTPPAWHAPPVVAPGFFSNRSLICADSSTVSHEVTMRWLGRGVDHPAEFTVNFHSAILRLVEEGLGFALLPFTPKLLGEGKVTVSGLEGGASMDVYCAYRRESLCRPVLRNLIESVLQVGRSIGQ